MRVALAPVALVLMIAVPASAKSIDSDVSKENGLVDLWALVSMGGKFSNAKSQPSPNPGQRVAAVSEKGDKGQPGQLVRAGQSDKSKVR